MLSKHARQRPSVIFRLHEFCERTTGIPGRDEWTAWQFDQAVTAFGRWVENKYNELDKNHKPKHTLEELLKEPGEKKRGRAILDFFGGENVPLMIVHPDGRVEPAVNAGDK